MTSEEKIFPLPPLVPISTAYHLCGDRDCAILNTQLRVCTCYYYKSSFEACEDRWLSSCVLSIAQSTCKRAAPTLFFLLVFLLLVPADKCGTSGGWHCCRHLGPLRAGIFFFQPCSALVDNMSKIFLPKGIVGFLNKWHIGNWSWIWALCHTSANKHKMSHNS